jgi:hypothetical protein
MVIEPCFNCDLIMHGWRFFMVIEVQHCDLYGDICDMVIFHGDFSPRKMEMNNGIFHGIQ